MLRLIDEQGKNIRGTGKNFKTSYVTVNRNYEPYLNQKFGNFKTSYVTVNRTIFKVI